MIGQSVINVSSGRGPAVDAGRGGLPAAAPRGAAGPAGGGAGRALTAVMIMVSLNTFSWRSLAQLRTNPLPSSAVMLATVLVVVATKDWRRASGRRASCPACSSPARCRGSARFSATLSEDGRTRTYRVTGQVFFFASATPSRRRSTCRSRGSPRDRCAGRAFLDISAVAALDRVVRRRAARADRRGRRPERRQRDAGRAIRNARQARRRGVRRRDTEPVSWTLRPRAASCVARAATPFRPGPVVSSGREKQDGPAVTSFSARDRVRTRSLHRRTATPSAPSRSPSATAGAASS